MTSKTWDRTPQMKCTFWVIIIVFRVGTFCASNEQKHMKCIVSTCNINNFYSAKFICILKKQCKRKFPWKAISNYTIRNCKEFNDSKHEASYLTETEGPQGIFKVLWRNVQKLFFSLRRNAKTSVKNTYSLRSSITHESMQYILQVLFIYMYL